jgi:hypothetical protein
MFTAERFEEGCAKRVLPREIGDHSRPGNGPEHQPMPAQTRRQGTKASRRTKAPCEPPLHGLRHHWTHSYRKTRSRAIGETLIPLSGDSLSPAGLPLLRRQVTPVNLVLIPPRKPVVHETKSGSARRILRRGFALPCRCSLLAWPGRWGGARVLPSLP